MTNKLTFNLSPTQLKLLRDLFKRHPEYVDLLKKDDLSTLYQINSFMDRWWITRCLYNAGIDPLDYLSFVPSNFIGISDHVLNLIIPNNILDINNNAFFNCEKLLSVTFGKNVHNIYDEAFSACLNLNKVEFNDQLVKIGSEIFRGCTNLKEINYMGSKEQWEQIDKDIDWISRSNIQKIICKDGVIEYV